MITSKSLFLISCLIIFLKATSAYRSTFRNIHSSTTGKQYTFNGQFIDHFNPLDGRTFAQRYWVDNTFYNPGPNSPIFLYLCGEGTCSGTPTNNSFPYQMAQKMGALSIAIEHRYYGLSQPFGPQSMKTENLRYLTVEQALEDIAYFISWFKDNYIFKIYDSQPWITIGGSYTGAVSAWFRNRYPHLTVGAWASSANTLVVLDFSDFDYQVSLSVAKSDPKCPEVIQNLTQYFEYQLYETTPDVQQALKKRFGDDALKLSNEELLCFVADSFAVEVQYGHRIDLCNFLTNSTDFDQLIDATISFTLDVNQILSYGAYFVSNDTFDPERQDLINRQWYYQSCSQLGYFQTYSDKTKYTMRSSRINLDYFKQFCKNVFGTDLWPDIDRFNNDFGGLDLKTTNVILPLGADDPWKSSMRNTTSGSMTSIFINCTCGDSIDFYGENATIPQALKDAHAEIQTLLLDYLGRTESVVIV